MTNERDARGRFVRGNSGGPGRPPLATELDYLAAITDAVSLDDWAKIAERAVADAKDGDDKARAWLSKHLLGSEPPDLTEIALRRHLGLTTDAEITVEAEYRMKSSTERNLDAISGRTKLRQALELIALD